MMQMQEQELQAPWPPDVFESHLRAMESRYHSRHPFNRRLNAGELQPFQVRGWVANRFYYQCRIPIKDAAILSNCDDRATRRRWIVRMLDQDGHGDHEGTNAGGIEIWTRLGLATGLRRETLDSHALEEAVISSLTEMFAPRIHQDRLAGWPSHYPWIDASGLDYFRSRIPLADRDVEHGLEVAKQWCTTRERQERALQILGFKLDILWAMLDVIEKAYPDNLPKEQQP